MKLCLFALVLIATSSAATAAFGQEYEHPTAQVGAAQISSGALEGLQNGNTPAEKQKLALQAEAQAQILLGPMSQQGCPVVLTSARLNWPASYLPVTSAEKITEPNLALGFRNSSGKAIRSISITARFLGKRNIYQLDASAFDLRLNFSAFDSADKTAEQLREIRVPEKMFAYGVTRVSLAQVLFVDGTFWTPFGHGNCSLDVQGSAERVAK